MGFVVDFVQKMFYYTVDGPVTVTRGIGAPEHQLPSGIVNYRTAASQRPYNYYHKEYRRVTPIEDCVMEDYVCMFEAESQYRRDKKVEEEIIKILRERVGICAVEEGPNAQINCKDILEEYEKTADDFEVKYGELGAVTSALHCMMKQKYRIYYDRKKAEQKQL